VLVNGGINLSELDGMVAKAYAPDLGWALGDGQEHGDDPAGTPRKRRCSTTCWKARSSPSSIPAMGRESRLPGDADAESMARLTPRFSADARCANTPNGHYLPAAAAHRMRTANKGPSQANGGLAAQPGTEMAALRFGTEGGD